MPNTLTAQTTVVTAKTAYEVSKWETFVIDARHYVLSLRDQLENIILNIASYNFDREEALNEIGLYGKLEFSLFAAVIDVAARLGLGMKIVQGSGDILA